MKPKTVWPSCRPSRPWRFERVSMKPLMRSTKFCSPSPSWWMWVSTSAMPPRVMPARTSRNCVRYSLGIEERVLRRASGGIGVAGRDLWPVPCPSGDAGAGDFLGGLKAYGSQ
jgi:hypothetical protein